MMQTEVSLIHYVGVPIYIVMKVWIQCLDLPVLMGWISYSCTWVVDLDEENPLDRVDLGAK
jgi:hypothetical protein